MQSTTLAIGADNALLANVTNVQTRSRVKAMYVEFVFKNSTVARTFNWYLAFNPQGSFTPGSPNATGASQQKNYIFKSGTITVDPIGQGPTTGTVRGMVKIPTKYQRLMIGDIIYFAFNSTFSGASATDLCYVKAIYKEIRG